MPSADGEQLPVNPLFVKAGGVGERGWRSVGALAAELLVEVFADAPHRLAMPVLRPGESGDEEDLDVRWKAIRCAPVSADDAVALRFKGFLESPCGDADPADSASDVNLLR